MFDALGNTTGFVFESERMAEVAKDSSAEKKAKAPMPGTISKLFVKEGDKIKKGEAIFAM